MAMTRPKFIPSSNRPPKVRCRSAASAATAAAAAAGTSARAATVPISESVFFSLNATVPTMPPATAAAKLHHPGRTRSSSIRLLSSSVPQVCRRRRASARESRRQHPRRTGSRRHPRPSRGTPVMACGAPERTRPRRPVAARGDHHRPDKDRHRVGQQPDPREDPSQRHVDQVSRGETYLLCDVVERLILRLVRHQLPPLSQREPCHSPAVAPKHAMTAAAVMSGSRTGPVAAPGVSTPLGELSGSGRSCQRDACCKSRTCRPGCPVGATAQCPAHSSDCVRRKR